MILCMESCCPSAVVHSVANDVMYPLSRILKEYLYLERPCLNEFPEQLMHLNGQVLVVLCQC